MPCVTGTASTTRTPLSIARRWATTSPFPSSPPTSASPPTAWPTGSTPSPQREGLHLPDRQHLESVLDKVYASGYPDSMIIQDFIPGDDSYMRVLTNYSDRNGKVKFMCLGHVLLEEHTPPRQRQPRRSSSTSPAGILWRRSRPSWRTSATWASPTLTSSTTSGTGSTSSSRSTAARGAATTTSPGRGTTWPACCGGPGGGEGPPLRPGGQAQPVAGGAPEGGLPVHRLRVSPPDAGADAPGEGGPAPVL